MFHFTGERLAPRCRISEQINSSKKSNLVLFLGCTLPVWQYGDVRKSYFRRFERVFIFQVGVWWELLWGGEEDAPIWCRAKAARCHWHGDFWLPYWKCWSSSLRKFPGWWRCQHAYPSWQRQEVSCGFCGFFAFLFLIVRGGGCSSWKRESKMGLSLLRWMFTFSYWLELFNHFQT